MRKTVALIPARGGSKSIPLKNIKTINGKPLIYWTLIAAEKCSYIDEIYVSTDSNEIRNIVEHFNLSKVRVVSRSEESSTDTASTEAVMIEFAENTEFDNIVLIQATSPLLTYEDLNNGFNLYLSDNTDSVLSAVRQKRFLWETNNHYGTPINYDIYNRPRRQDFDGYLVENGAFYITSKELLLKSKNRISGNIKVVEMPEDTYHEIDEPVDWKITEQLLYYKSKNRNKINTSEIKMVISDCDGVLTDGGMYYTEHGDEIKKFNTKDGMAFQILRDKGIVTCIITGEDREMVRNRAKKLNINELYMGINNKMDIVDSLCKKYNIELEEIVYIGDDINDLECIKKCGYTICPSDAVDMVKREADYICNAKGGEGVVREAIYHLF
ncbi:acylneuraminate cytidylyltransferase [Anaerocolumna cellulosilytica]|uniref:N-acylneuraminate cytidylyltransferase n=1 Tax=Anaerocolumna cellulosilytica TaxID=433286 RepID=A0A6S6QTF3_9FIRM|nr:N-acylneuraminate cytidylyltransferase [Anaerocolumna cellulosilytica]MBB5195718.1 N-acylneuraminate cytidylyltransferase [Anaerocolumna cellulosilytica]BCJ92946.1 acylneuraminate cytidylyltransferase [Anaerocolumna cellulosilytica]